MTVVFAGRQIETRDYNYNRDILFTLFEDFASVLLLPVVIVGGLGGIGGIAVISMVIYTIVWYILFNLLTWSSPFRPKE